MVFHLFIYLFIVYTGPQTTPMRPVGCIVCRCNGFRNKNRVIRTTILDVETSESGQVHIGTDWNYATARSDFHSPPTGLRRIFPTGPVVLYPQFSNSICTVFDNIRSVKLTKRPLYTIE